MTHKALILFVHCYGFAGEKIAKKNRIEEERRAKELFTLSRLG